MTIFSRVKQFFLKFFEVRPSTASDRYRTSLEVARVELQNAVEAKLAADISTDVSPELTRINALSSAATGQPKSWRLDLLLSFLASILCIALIWIAVHWRVSSVEFGFVIESQAIEVVAADRWRGLDISFTSATTFDVRGGAVADLRGALPSLGVVTRPSTLRFDATAASIQIPIISKASTIRLSCYQDGTIEFAMLGDPTEMNIVLAEKARIRGRGRVASSSTEAPFDDTVGEPNPSIVITSERGRALAIRMKRKDLKLVLAGPIQRLSFPEDQPTAPNMATFSSAIVKGEIVVHTVSSTQKLARFDAVSTRDIKGAITIETAGDECLKANFEGSAARLQAGRLATAMTDLTPSQLTYLFQEKGVPFFLSVFGTLWGLIWGGLSWARQRST